MGLKRLLQWDAVLKAALLVVGVVLAALGGFQVVAGKADLTGMLVGALGCVLVGACLLPYGKVLYEAFHK